MEVAWLFALMVLMLHSVGDSRVLGIMKFNRTLSQHPIFNDMGNHGTKIIIYNLWHNDTGETELDFEIDEKVYCSILYLHMPDNFKIILYECEVEHHYIARDLKYCECVQYRAHVGEKIEPFHHGASYRGKGVVGCIIPIWLVMRRKFPAQLHIGTTCMVSNHNASSVPAK
ncbi:protein MICRORCHIDIA 5-like isoform X2 [Zingiber officinale]|uniref:protein MICRORCHIDIA 5-like isoform X2 n=1 Tax=Zingiber officinale TaxID=94328 RepID=UPI001C4D1494|nr:protein MICRORCHIDIA 5-like isoform X2 [Zingiber officinale]